AAGGPVGINGGRLFSIDFYLGRSLTPVRTPPALDAWLVRPERPIAIVTGRAWAPMKEQLTTPAEVLDVMRVRAHEMVIVRRAGSRAETIERATAEALARLTGGRPFVVDCRPAWEALELPDRTVLHSGPPIAWERMCEPVQAAVLCAIRYEEWAANDDAARRLVERGDV